MNSKKPEPFNKLENSGTYSNTKTYSNTETIYVGIPPTCERAGKNTLKLNKDRFNSYDEAWNCFEYEDPAFRRATGNPDTRFSIWLFEPYIPET